MIIGRTVDLGEERRKQALYAAELRQQIAERDHARRGGAEPEAAAREGPIQTPFPGTPLKFEHVPLGATRGAAGGPVAAGVGAQRR